MLVAISYSRGNERHLTSQKNSERSLCQASLEELLAFAKLYSSTGTPRTACLCNARTSRAAVIPHIPHKHFHCLRATHF